VRFSEADEETQKEKYRQKKALPSFDQDRRGFENIFEK